MATHTVSSLAQELKDHKKECLEVTKRIDGRLETIEKTPGRVIKWVGGLIIAAIITVLTQNWFLHRQAAQVAATAASAVTVSTDVTTATLAANQAIILKKLSDIEAKKK